MTIATKTIFTHSAKISTAYDLKLDGERFLENHVDRREENSHAPTKPENIFTVVDVFSSRIEAKSAVLEMQRQGLLSSQIVIVARDYQEHQESMYWQEMYRQDIDWEARLTRSLIELGVNTADTLRFVEAVGNGKFLVIALVINREARQTQYMLQNIGRKVIAVY